MICFHWTLDIEIVLSFLVLKFVFQSRHHNGVLTKLLTGIKIDVVPHSYKSTIDYAPSDFDLIRPVL